MVPQDIIQPTQPSVSKPEHVTAFVQKWHVAFEMRITTTPNESKGLVHAGWPPPDPSCTPTPPGKHAGTADTFVEAGRLSSPLGRLPDALAGLRLHSAGGNHRASIRPLDFSESAPHKQHNRTQHNREDRVSKLAQWRSEMHLLLFMQLSRSSSRTQSLSSHRSTRKRTFNNIRVKHSSISARATRFSLTNTPPQLLLGQLLYTTSPWSPDLALSNQSEPNPAQLWLVLKRGPS